MQNTARRDGCHTILVCVDSFEGDIPVGRFYHAVLSEGCQFHCLMQFIQEMEKVLDKMDFPRSFDARHTFSAAPLPIVERAQEEEQTGRLATFSLRILFRQNVSWQGSITWMEGRQEQSFRSALECVLMMQSALNAAGEK